MAESLSERVDELLQPAATKPGDAPADELGKLRPICMLAEENYQGIIGIIGKMKDAEGVLLRFHAKQENVTPQELEKAKTQFDEAKQSYLQLGNQINDGIKAVHALAKIYTEDLLVQNLYKTYLAKLLCSLETRNPVEAFVRRLADWTFAFDRMDLKLSEEEERRGLTMDRKRLDLLGACHRTVVMLETRYQKRLLQNSLKQGEGPQKIIRRVRHLVNQDPEDLHTYIWLASLMARELGKERNQSSRAEAKEEILQTCKKAFSLIDDFLNLQGIQNLSERDKRRSEYVKTITGIRNPLVRKESE